MIQEGRANFVSPLCTGKQSQRLCGKRGVCGLLNKIVSYSDVRLHQVKGVDDKIVTLCTCTGNESTRYVVQEKEWILWML